MAGTRPGRPPPRCAWPSSVRGSVEREARSARHAESRSGCRQLGHDGEVEIVVVIGVGLGLVLLWRLVKSHEARTQVEAAKLGADIARDLMQQIEQYAGGPERAREE